MMLPNSENLKRASEFLLKRIATIFNRSDSIIEHSARNKIAQLINGAQSYMFYYDYSDPTYFSIEDRKILNVSILDLPSKTLHIEVGNGIIGRIGSKQDIQNNKFCIHSLIVHEVSPENYEFLILVNNNSIYFFNKNHDQYECLVHLTFEVLKNLQKFKIGVQEVKEKIVIKSAKQKIKRTINKIIHVHPRNWNDETSELLGRQIDYSHRFLVRGHWRKCNFIGKDREGNYTVNGFTWISEHIKGPENKPLIADKIRIESGKLSHGNILVT